VVAVLLRLRFQVLANTLRRNKLQLVAVILGAFQALVLLGFVVIGLIVASTAPPAATQTVVVVGGSLLVLGWMLIPVLFEGVEQTLDPQKLAPFPLRIERIMLAMFLVGVTWVPGVATIAASLGVSIAWRAHPLAVLASLAAGAIGAATAIAGSRLITAVTGALLRGRGVQRIGIVVVLVAALLTPAAAAAVSGVAHAGPDPLTGFTAAVDVLGWTPFGAVWSIPGRLVMGDGLGALAATAVALATLAFIVLIWRVALAVALRQSGGMSARVVSGGRLGILSRVPASPAGAIAARSLIYWFRDPRYSRQLLIIPILPALTLLWWALIHIDALALAAGPVVASLLPLAVFAAISYDGTAFAAQVAAGTSGRDDRVGRAAALLTVALPAVIVVQVVVAGIIGRVADLPALLGLSLAVLFSATGVVSVSSARIVVPVARAGRHPFSAPAGAATTSLIASYAVTGVTMATVVPAVVLTVLALVMGLAWLGWVAAVVGVVLGVAVLIGGIALGARVLDRSAPAVLARLRLIRA
jgi:ABC-2 type transport system permease protein